MTIALQELTVTNSFVWCLREVCQEINFEGWQFNEGGVAALVMITLQVLFQSSRVMEFIWYK